jgi:hypothetical protein
MASIPLRATTLLALAMPSIFAELKYAETLPSYAPGRSRRECHVHNCPTRSPDDNYANAKRCPRKRGHMQPMGHQSEMAEVPRVSAADLDGATFYERYIATSTPILLADVAAASVSHKDWDDRFMLAHCKNGRGVPWQAVIEVNKFITTNTRWPLQHDWDFCDFIQNYSKPEHENGLYCISALTTPDVDLGKYMEMPPVLRCPELHESIHNTRLWMSSGETRSSLHFDTHENLMLQLDGTKSVYFWPPSESHLLYMDYHDRFGLSPVHPEKVDLEQWPLFGSLRGGLHAKLQKGDALFIPDGWWHQVLSWPGRNVAVAWEFEPYEGIEQLWPPEADFHGYVHDPRRSQQVRTKYYNKRLTSMRYLPIACNASALPQSVTAETFQCDESHSSALGCNFECLPYTCVTQQMMEHAAKEQTVEQGRRPQV